MIAIHQPNFAPWLGYFYKWAVSDAFVMLDDVQFSKGSYINRNRILTQNGVKWLTVPVSTSGSFKQTILETRISGNMNWRKKILTTVDQNYRKSAHFAKYYPEFKNVLAMDTNFLVDVNVSMLKWIAKELGIKKPVFRSSEMDNILGSATNRLVSICKAMNAKTYLAGFGGVNYHDQKVFEGNDIEVAISGFRHPEYSQCFGNKFTPNLSVIDLLFNHGPSSLKLILEGE